MNIIEKGQDKVASVVSYATEHKDRVIKTAIDGVLLFIIFAVFGCFDFLNFTFQIEKLASVAYWSKTLLKTIAGLCAYNIGIDMVWDKQIDKSLELKTEREKYERLLKLKDNVSFNYYIINVFNREEKKKAYIDDINYKIYKLNKHAKNKDKLLFDRIGKNEEETKLIEEQKANNKYCIAMKELLELKSDEYIERNLDNISVKYSRIDPIIFDLELDCKHKYNGIKISGNVNVGKAKKTASVLVSMLGISALLTSIGMDANSQQFEEQMQSFWSYFISTAIDFFTVAWQCIRGTGVARGIISNELTTPLHNRNDILIKYSQWCLDNNIEKSKSQLIYEKIIEQENVGKEISA